MVNINLLPKWHIMPIKSMIFALATLVIVIFLHLQYHRAMLEKEEKINLLKKEIHHMESEISSLSPKNKGSIQKKYIKNCTLFILLKKLPHLVPIGLYLTELSIGKNHCKLIGYTEKIAPISDFATKLTHLRFDVSLQEMQMEKEADDFPIKFCLSVKSL